MLDAVNLERRGLPAVVVGQDLLVNTTGIGMARAQGYPGIRFAVIPYSYTTAASPAELQEDADNVAVQVVRILTGTP